MPSVLSILLYIQIAWSIIYPKWSAEMNNSPSWKCLWEASKGLARQIVALNRRLLFSALSFKFNQSCIWSSSFSCKNYCHHRHFHRWNGNGIYYNPIAIVNLTYEEMLGGGGEDLMETTCVRRRQRGSITLAKQPNWTNPLPLPVFPMIFISRNKTISMSCGDGNKPLDMLINS